MGVERLQDGDDDPSQRADAAAPKDAGHSAAANRSGDADRSEDADRSGDADHSGDAGRPEDAGRSTDPDHSGDTHGSGVSGRSGEADRSGEVPRSGEPPPESSARDSPETTDAAVKRAESRSRSEYADDIAPPGSSPIDGDPPKHGAEEPNQLEDEHLEAMLPKGERPDASPTEEHQAEGRMRVPNGLGSSDEQPLSPDALLEQPVKSENVNNDKPDDERPWAPQPTGEFGSHADGLEVDHGYEAEDETFGDTLHHEDSVRRNDDGPEPVEEAANQDDKPTNIQVDDLPGIDKDAGHIEDKPHPLSNQEWAEHLDEVRDGLEEARAAGLRTTHLYTIDGKGQVWSEERDLLHDSIIDDFYTRAADVPCDSKAIMAGGLSGAGKTTVLTEHAGIDLTQYLMINPDDFKQEMARRGMLPEIEGLSPMEASDLAHEESSYLAKRLARRAQAEGKNLIWDITMATQDSTSDRIRSLRESGYTHLDGVFVDIPIEISVERTESRHREGHENYRSGIGIGGRFVPPEVIRNQSDREWSSQNRRTYEAVKDSFSSWTIYDNSVDGRAAVLIDSSDRRHEP